HPVGRGRDLPPLYELDLTATQLSPSDADDDYEDEHGSAACYPFSLPAWAHSPHGGGAARRDRGADRSAAVSSGERRRYDEARAQPGQAGPCAVGALARVDRALPPRFALASGLVSPR